jgi:REP element-mobilizing transposase RayT
MPRIARMLIQEKEAVYHVMSYTALPGFPLEDVEKDFLFELIKKLSKVFFAEILGCCVMGNHFHLLARMHLDSDYSDEQIKKRYKLFYGGDKIIPEGLIPSFREKWSSLSEFVKEIKQQFTRYYNKRHDRRGYFWGDRFKSLIVENGETLVNCLAYIDLNPVRAGIVSKPEDYRWNSLGYHIQTNNKDGFLSLDFGMKEFGPSGTRAAVTSEFHPDGIITSKAFHWAGGASVKSKKDRLRLYRKFIYETGAIDATGTKVKISEGVVEKQRKKDFELTRADLFKQRTRYFTDSGIIGSKEFVRENFQRFNHLFQSKNERIPRHVVGLDGIYSMKRLSIN